MFRLLLVACTAPAVALRISEANPSEANATGPNCMQKEHITNHIKQFLAAKPAYMLQRTECPPVKFIDPPRSRLDLGRMLAKRGLAGVGVEVGVQAGKYMKILVEAWHPAIYIQVDLWKHQENYDDLGNHPQPLQDIYSQQSCEVGLNATAAGKLGEVIQCRDFSTECAKLIPEGSLDFVYIDARHDRKGILEDLHAYWGKLKVGGIMAGHDYMAQDEVSNVMARLHLPNQDWTLNYDGSSDTTGQVVRGAVNDFFSGTLSTAPWALKQCPRQPVITYREDAWNTWIVTK